MTSRPDVAGLVLAAGAGHRYGGPKAMAVDGQGRSWLSTVVQTLGEAGLEPVIVVLGAAPQAARLVPPTTTVVVTDQWHRGMSVSLVEGLAEASTTDAEAAVVALVDQPDLPVEVLDRLLAPGISSAVLRRMSYAGIPGHPVLIGRDHWAAMSMQLHGDVGAKDYLAAHATELVPGDDLWDGADIDESPVRGN